MYSTTMTPPAKYARLMAITWKVGPSALGRAWRRSTHDADDVRRHGEDECQCRQDDRDGLLPRSAARRDEGDRGQDVKDGRGKEDDERDAHDELRERGEHQGDQRGGEIEGAISPQRRIGTDQDRQRNGDQSRAEEKKGRVDKAVTEQLADRLLRRERPAGVTVNQTDGPGDVLLHDRPVEVKLLTEGGEAGGRCAAAEDCARRIAW